MAERLDVGAIRRAQIVEAASRVIVQKGFHNATLAEVEAEAGISRGMMTYYFRTKDAMVAAVFEATINNLCGPLGTEPANVTPLDRLDRAIDVAIQSLRSGGELACLRYTFLAQAAHRADYRARFASLDDRLRARLADNLRDAGHGVDPARQLADLIVCAIRGLEALVQVDREALDLGELATTLKQLARPTAPAE